MYPTVSVLQGQLSRILEKIFPLGYTGFMAEKTFGEVLRRLREEAGLTQVQLAERAGLHRQAVVKLELGLREPAWATVKALCRALGVSCAVFDDAPKKKRG